MIGDVVLRSVDLFHTGIVVDDLAAARDALGRDLGLTWRRRRRGGQAHHRRRRPHRARAYALAA